MNKWIDISFAAALGASLAFHGASINAPKVYQWITGTKLPSSYVLPKKAPPPKVSFKFVDSPDKVFESEKAKETDRISDKETIARDKKIDEKKATPGRSFDPQRGKRNSPFYRPQRVDG